MSRPIKSQKAGKGSPKYRTKSGKYYVCYPNNDEKQSKDIILGEIKELINDSARNSVIAKIITENGKNHFIIAAEGIMVGEKIELGVKAQQKIGNILPLKSINEGMPVFNIEKHNGDGGKLVKSSGEYAVILSKSSGKVNLKMPSNKIILIEENARATIGNASSGGRKEKPFVKAGKKFKAKKARSKPYPKVRAIAMNAVDHPFGGTHHHPGKGKSSSRRAPPGKKVGNIASRRTGKGKKRKNKRLGE